MKYRSRIYYSAEQKNLMWDRWQAGDSLHEIARLFDRGRTIGPGAVICANVKFQDSIGFSVYLMY